ncbi:hypothetical protein DMO16_01345 [Fictibacillus sp. S7]|nr:hypothetical protein DMO16_01345 [Fictibacillus sp. S7]
MKNHIIHRLLSFILTIKVDDPGPKQSIDRLAEKTLKSTLKFNENKKFGMGLMIKFKERKKEGI